MEERQVCHIQENKPWSRTDVALLLALLVLATSVRAWLFYHTEVTARDSIGFIRYAWELDHRPWKQVFQTQLHPPGYPLTIWAMSKPVRYCSHAAECDVMQAGAQLASGLAGILLVIPMFLLGRELFDRRAGFWSAALFQCMPACARVISDALTESLFYFLVAWSLLFAVQALRSRSWFRFSLSGGLAGLAYLTRPEGLVVILAIGLVLAGLQFFPVRRWHWRQVCACGTGLTAAAIAVAAPYAITIGGLTNKTTGAAVLKPDSISKVNAAFPLAVWWPDGKESGPGGRFLWSLKAVGAETLRGFFYVAWISVVLGLYGFRSRFRDDPGLWLPVVLCLVHFFVLLRVAMVGGYVSERHVIMFVFCGLFWGSAAFLRIPSLSALSEIKLIGWAPVLLMTAIACAGLTRTLMPMHANRAGHHAAGNWLALNAKPDDAIHDPYLWAAHYAGRTFLSETNPEQPARRFHVRERRKRDHNRFPVVSETTLIEAGGTVVFHWPNDRPTENAEILIYAISQDR